MAQETRNWRELCWAIVNEQDSEKLAELAQRLLAVLEERESEGPLSATNNAISWPNVNRFSGG
jgi:hypothetical protein